MKRIFFSNLLLLALLATLSCNTEDGSGHRGEDGSQFLGTWQLPQPNCPTCGRWVFSETKEGGTLAEYYKQGGGKIGYPASYDPATKMMLIETGGGLKAGIVNGELKVRGLTYHKIDGVSQDSAQ